MAIRALIVDDESLARSRTRALLEDAGDVEVVGECADGREAVRELEARDVDLLFLDIKMPELDGLGVVEAVGPENMPATVFVTAYEDFAVKAFDLHAIDYLLKPFDRERFAAALGRARERLESDSSAAVSRRLAALVDDLKSSSGHYAERLIVKSSNRLVLVKVETIDWIDAAGNYVRLNVGEKQYRLRAKISSLEGQLDPKRFLRIHRSTIVNSEAIREIRSLPHGEGLVVLEDGRELGMSRSYREKITSLLS